MDFRTEWSSWLLIVFMMIIAYVIYPFGAETTWLMYAAQVVGMPFVTIAIACIPVLVICYFIKKIPDIDYSIRLAFAYMLILFIQHLITA